MARKDKWPRQNKTGEELREQRQAAIEIDSPTEQLRARLRTLRSEELRLANLDREGDDVADDLKGVRTERLETLAQLSRVQRA